MEIILRVNASRSEGFGHFIRSMSLANLLQENGHSITILSNELNPILDNEMSTVLINEDELHTVKDLEILRTLIKNKNADWVILDGYLFNQEYEKSVYQSSAKLCRIDDLPSHQYYCDVLLSQNFGAESFGFNCVEGCKKAFGLDYLMLRNQFKSEKAVKLNPLKILITLGGSNSSKAALIDLIKVVDDKKFSKYKFTIVASSGLDIESKFNNISVVDFTSKLAQEMKESHLVITSAGSTMWELMYLRVPFLPIGLNVDQVEYLKILEKADLCTALNVNKLRECERNVDILEKYLNNKEFRQQLVENYKKVVNISKIDENLLNLFR